jgi:hypothetical protein
VCTNQHALAVVKGPVFASAFHSSLFPFSPCLPAFEMTRFVLSQFYRRLSKVG